MQNESRYPGTLQLQIMSYSLFFLSFLGVYTLHFYDIPPDQSDMALAVYATTTADGGDTDKALEYAGVMHRSIVLIHSDTLIVSRYITA